MYIDGQVCFQAIANHQTAHAIGTWQDKRVTLVGTINLDIKCESFENHL